MPDAAAQLEALVTRFTEDIKRLALRAAQEALAGAPGFKGGGAATASRAVGGTRLGSKRIRRSSGDLQRRSGEFLAFVSQNPGLRIEEINAALGTRTSDLRLPIRKLLADKSVRAEGRLRATRYFPA